MTAADPVARTTAASRHGVFSPPAMARISSLSRSRFERRRQGGFDGERLAKSAALCLPLTRELDVGSKVD
ncbi:uncharacterized protein DS421_18g628790 [Arachis hypogaea]|nr:uncharacterized protein DS421_18g628790 [Arachis hypogaea]